MQWPIAKYIVSIIQRFVIIGQKICAMQDIDSSQTLVYKFTPHKTTDTQHTIKGRWPYGRRLK